MLNSISDIKTLWPGDALNLDDVTVVQTDPDKTSYDLFLENEGDRIRRRLIKWVGADAYDDASSGDPSDTDRADALKEAEFELFHINIMEKLWRDKSAGVERDIQLPSGMRITLQAFSGDDYKNIISTHLAEAQRAVMEYISQ